MQDDIWDRWERYHEIAQLELVTHNLDLLTAQLNEAQAAVRKLLDTYSMGDKPNKDDKQ